MEEATVWLAQAKSDFRVARALQSCPEGMSDVDVGCHVAAMCAQAIEKSIKGYVVLNGATPALGDRPDKYLPQLLTRDDPLLRYQDHYRHLSKLFDQQTKHAVRDFLDLTPGGRGNRTDVPNTEYPWKVEGAWARAPADNRGIGSAGRINAWLRIAKRVCDTLNKLVIAAGRGAFI